MNYITPTKTLEATKLVTKGKSYRLAIETNTDTPAYAPRTFNVTITQPTQVAGGSLGPTKTTYNDDMVVGWNGVGTQIDGLGHIGIDYLYYNCNNATDFVATDGLKKLGVEHAAHDYKNILTIEASVTPTRYRQLFSTTTTIG